MTIIPVKRALLSVSDKTDLAHFAKALSALDIEIISTGGTSQVLREKEVKHRQVETITDLPEMLNGRVKTLHPKIHGGILGRRDRHAAEAQEHDIHWIDLVVVNFYPFAQIRQQKNVEWEELVEYIDIGGPSMVRAAAKNFAWVGVVVDPKDYAKILAELHEKKGLSFALRKTLAEKAFGLTSSYDAMIHQMFLETDKEDSASQPSLPAQFLLRSKKKQALRYGENPHQKAAAYQFYPAQNHPGLLSAQQVQGKELSFNNILDADAAWQLIQEFDQPTVAVIKHGNPCGVSSAVDIETACTKAMQADAQSAFGGVVALNGMCTRTTAEILTQFFIEIVLAPDYTEDALEIFKSKSNLRILRLPGPNNTIWDAKYISGGFLLQEKDQSVLEAKDLQIVTQRMLTQKERDDLLFAWRVLKHIKSNAILIAKDQCTVGIGSGQVSRIDAVEMAIRKGKDNLQDAILASEAFFPFRDSIDHIAKTPIRAIIQPGGSKQDSEVIKACDEHGIAMVFTSMRCFRH